MHKQTIFLVSSTLAACAALLVLLCLLGSIRMAYAVGPHYVAPGGNCGAASPCYATLQAAVDAADDGDVIKVAQGIYTGVQNAPGLNTATFTATQVVVITKSVTLRGGYNDNFTAWDPDTYRTILDAQGQGRGIAIVGSAITPAVEGLHVTGGDAVGLGGSPWGGRRRGRRVRP